ncbi:hypothetical protein A1WI_04705 [Escherichia coli KTE98]|nr:hypothetical protein A1WI_04705 [Escherichia coli KTE98]
MLTKRILFSLMLIVSPCVVASEKAHELYDSIYGGQPAPDVINRLHKMAELGDVDAQSNIISLALIPNLMFRKRLNGLS